MAALAVQFSLLFYRFFLVLYQLAIRIAARNNPKAAKWWNGRKGLLDEIQKKYMPDEKAKVIWMHVASLGEFEQGRPLIEKIKASQPDTVIVLTFFSPSGYEVRKNYDLADYVFYLPMDGPRNARRFISIIKPHLVVFVKYEFWYYYFKYLSRHNIPLIMISCIFRKKHIFFKWYGWMHRAMLRCVTHFFVQDNNSALLMEQHGFHKLSVVPDTRIDRVANIARQAKTLPLIEQFLKGEKAFIGGSFYQKENEILYEVYRQGLIAGPVIIAPHQVDAAHVNEIAALWGNEAILYTEINEDNIKDAKVLIVNTVGMLSALYRYADYAFIGGGFGKGIHNTLEPAAFGVPIFFGPNFKKFFEAEVMLNTGGAYCVNNADELKRVLMSLNDYEAWTRAAKASGAYIHDNTGGTEMIYHWLKLATYL